MFKMKLSSAFLFIIFFNKIKSIKKQKLNHDKESISELKLPLNSHYQYFKSSCRQTIPSLSKKTTTLLCSFPQEISDIPRYQC